MNDKPTSWELSTIGEITQYIQRGKSPKYTDRSALPVINQKCIRWNELQLQHLKFIHPDQFDAWDESRFIKPGDILWNSTGTGTVGRAYLVKEADCALPKVVDSHVTIVRSASEFDARYLFNWIKSPAVQSKIEEMCDGTTNQIELSRTAIAATAIPIAPREEQTRIADQLDTLLARVNACNHRLEAIPGILKRFRQAVLDQAASGSLTKDWRLGKDSGRVDWRTVTLQEVISEMRNGLAQKPTERPPGKKILRIGAVRGGQLDLSDHRYLDVSEREVKQYELRKGDLLFTRYNGSLEFVGVCAALAQDAPGYVYPDKLIRVRVRNDVVLPKFVEIVFGSRSIRQQVEGLVKSSAGQRGISGADLKGTRFRLALLQEQAEIVRRVEALFALADRIEASLNTARTHVKRLAPRVLAKAFRGELVRQDPQDEPVKVLLQRIACAQPAKVQASRGRPRTQNKELPFLQPQAPSNWLGLPDGAWNAPADPEGHAAVVLLTAVLKAWGAPMPQEQARLATLLCQQPRFFTAVLPADEAAQWRRLVGVAADTLPAQVARLQPATDSHWRRALAGMRTRSELVESESGAQETWALRAGAAHIQTAGWPDGRAQWVVAYLQAHGIEAILPLLEPVVREFVNVRAA